MKKNIIITGGAGFIGSNLCEKLLKLSFNLTCIDNFDDFYNPEIKRKNIEELSEFPNFKFIYSDVKNIEYIKTKLNDNYSAIIHLAAKAGVRYSLKNAHGYQENNEQGTNCVLKIANDLHIDKVIFASSSSVYANVPTPFKETYENLNPLSPYAKTKLISEIAGCKFAENNNKTFISLRLFSVYGPKLRPDLVMNKIAESLFLNNKLQIFGDGNAARDYTYVEDVTEAFCKALDYNKRGFNIFNIGNGAPVKLNEIITYSEQITARKVNVEFLNPIDGELDITYADNSIARKELLFSPKFNINQGLKKYLDWFVKEKIV